MPNYRKQRQPTQRSQVEPNRRRIKKQDTAREYTPRRPPPRRERTADPLPQEIVDPTSNKAYHVLTGLGYGAFGRVFLVRDDEERRLKACKMQIVTAADSLGSQRTDWSLVQELAPLLLLDHPNIIKFYSYFVTLTHSLFLMEYCDLGTIQRLLNKRKDTLVDPEIRYLAKPLLSAMAYIHDCHLHHRDIKPSNVLLNGHSPGSPLIVKLCDFGASCTFGEDGMVLGRVGSPNYVAPETLRGHKKTYHGPSADVWGIGCFLYALVYGEPPFLADSQSKIIRRVHVAEYEFPEEKAIDPTLKDLIQRCLSLNPEERPTVWRMMGSDYFCRSYIPRPTELQEIYVRAQDYAERIEKYVPPPRPPRPARPVPFAETFLGKKMKLCCPDRELPTQIQPQLLPKYQILP